MSGVAERLRLISGCVVSDKMDKTIVVEVLHRKRHARIGKSMNRSKKMHVHDPENSGREGDQVLIRASRPLSKHKRWWLHEVISK